MKKYRTQCNVRKTVEEVVVGKHTDERHERNTEHEGESEEKGVFGRDVRVTEMEYMQQL